jgi:hypothetical protein
MKFLAKLIVMRERRDGKKRDREREGGGKEEEKEKTQIW